MAALRVFAAIGAGLCTLWFGLLLVMTIKAAVEYGHFGRPAWQRDIATYAVLTLLGVVMTWLAIFTKGRSAAPLLGFVALVAIVVIAAFLALASRISH